MAHRAHPRRAARILGFILLVSASTVLSGCLFYTEYLVPHHANVGDRLALRDMAGTEPLLSQFEVLFGTTATQSIISQTPKEIVVEIPPGIDGEVRVSVWLGLFLLSNISPFQVDAVPISYRILAFGDSLVGPWVYHTHMLDTMLNENIGPSLVINEGKEGEYLSEGAQRLGDVLSIHTGLEYIYILEGANDVADETNTPVGQMLASLDQMMAQVSAYSLHPILITVPPRTRAGPLRPTRPGRPLPGLCRPARLGVLSRFGRAAPDRRGAAVCRGSPVFRYSPSPLAGLAPTPATIQASPRSPRKRTSPLLERTKIFSTRQVTEKHQNVL